MSTGISPDCFDVAVLGGGPTGVTLAGLLGRCGLRVLLLEKATAVHPQPRAVGFDHDAMRIFQRLGAAQALAPHLAPFRSAEYIGLEGRVIQRVHQQAAPWPLHWRPNYTCDQPGVESVLREVLASMPNVTVKLGHEVQHVDDRGDHVRVHARDAQSGQHVVSARWAVACDGASSPLRRQLGIRLRSLDYEVPWVVVDMQVRPDCLDRLPATNVQYCNPARPTTHVVCPGNHRRWEFMLLPGEDPDAPLTPQRLWQLLSPWLTPDQAQIWRAAAYRFHALIATSWRKGQILLAGDAVHQTPPFMGQGMCQGIRDAGNLAWKLALVVQGQAPAGLLDTYEAERAPHVEATTALAKKLGVLISELDPSKARARDEALLTSGGGSPPVLVRQDLIPGLTAGLVAAGQALAGRVVPQPCVQVIGLDPGADACSDLRLLDDVVGEQVHVLVLDDVPDTDLHQLLQLAGPAGVPVVRVAPPTSATARCAPAPGLLYVQEVEAVLRPWLAAAGCAGVVVRPDHYAYGAFQNASAATRMLRRLMDELTGDGPSSRPPADLQDRAARA